MGDRKNFFFALFVENPRFLRFLAGRNAILSDFFFVHIKVFFFFIAKFSHFLVRKKIQIEKKKFFYRTIKNVFFSPKSDQTQQ